MYSQRSTQRQLHHHTFPIIIPTRKPGEPLFINYRPNCRKFFQTEKDRDLAEFAVGNLIIEIMNGIYTSRQKTDIRLEMISNKDKTTIIKIQITIGNLQLIYLRQIKIDQQNGIAYSSAINRFCIRGPEDDISAFLESLRTKDGCLVTFDGKKPIKQTRHFHFNQFFTEQQCNSRPNFLGTFTENQIQKNQDMFALKKKEKKTKINIIIDKLDSNYSEILQILIDYLQQLEVEMQIVINKKTYHGAQPDLGSRFSWYHDFRKTQFERQYEVKKHKKESIHKLLQVMQNAEETKDPFTKLYNNWYESISEAEDFHSGTGFFTSCRADTCARRVKSLSQKTDSLVEQFHIRK